MRYFAEGLYIVPHEYIEANGRQNNNVSHRECAVAGPDEEGVFTFAMLSDTFTWGYSSLLRALHQAFNGSPETIDTAIGLMYQLRLGAQQLMSTPLKKGSDRNAGPVYKYVTVEGG